MQRHSNEFPTLVIGGKECLSTTRILLFAKPTRSTTLGMNIGIGKNMRWLAHETMRLWSRLLYRYPDAVAVDLSLSYLAMSL